MMIPSVFTLLLLYQFTVTLDCAYVNVSSSSTNVKVNGSLVITVLGYDPPAANMYRLVLRYESPSGTISEIAEYDQKFDKSFIISSDIPAADKGRVNISSPLTITISPVIFADEKKKYFFRYEFRDGKRNVILSRKVELHNVYDLPVFASSLQTVYTAIEGIPKPITCSVKSRPASNITWSHDAEVVGVATQNVIRDGYYFITTGTFTIEKPLYSMRGKNIFCTGKPKFGAPIKQNTTLNVLYKPKGTVFTVTPSELTLSAEVKMTCSATGIPSVRSYNFYRNGLLIGNTTDGKLSFNVHPSNCSRYNGEYKCVPESTIGDGEMKTETRKFNWNLTLKPSSAINEGQDAVLNCSNTICPTSNISWKLNGAILPNSGNELKIISATKDNAGTYSCHPSHYNKMKLAEIALNVRYKPDTVIFTSDTLKPVNQHKVTLTCFSNGFPTPQYRIFNVSGTSSTLISDGASGNYSMASINYADYIGYNATFMCISYNTFGNSSAKYIQLDIRVKPLLVTPSHLKVKKGANVAFSCKILAANPATNVTWTGPLNQAIQHSNGVVKINNIASNQLGIYSCHANNSVGKTTKTVTLSFDLSGGVGTILSSKVATIGSVIVGLAIVIMISDI